MQCRLLAVLLIAGTGIVPITVRGETGRQKARVKTTAVPVSTRSTTKKIKSKKIAPSASAKVEGVDRGKLKSKAPPKVAAIPSAGGKVAVFAFRGDDVTTPVHAQVVRLLRNKGLTVITTLRPVDSAVQYRDMAITLGLAVYVEGEVNDNGDRASAVVRIRSGMTGRRVASARFSSERRQLPVDVGRTLWAEVGSVLSRACADAAKPRKHANAPMRIEAGTPIENTPREPEEGT